MGIRDDFLNLCAGIRPLAGPGGFDILTTRVFVRTVTWTGTTDGPEARAGEATIVDAEILPRPRVRHVSPSSVRIGPIQPSCAAGGILLSDLLSVSDVAGEERVLFHVVDPLGNEQDYVADDVDASMALHYTVHASAIGPGRIVPNAR